MALGLRKSADPLDLAHPYRFQVRTVPGRPGQVGRLPFEYMPSRYAA